MEHVEIYERPVLREPVLIASFAGWNDAAEVATSSARLLVRQLGGRRLAAIDAEEFYVFTETRPRVRIVRGATRRIDWPANEFFAVKVPDSPRDLLALIGVEPQLHWKTFTRAIVEVAREFGVGLVVSLGGLLADAPHTRPARLTGSATTPELQERLRSLRVGGSRYEGPTGILGVLGAAIRTEGLPSVSIWGNVPHYISTSSNPRVSLAMLRQVAQLLDLSLDLSSLERQADAFDSQVDQAVAQNAEIQEYVRQLEQRDEGDAEGRGEEERTPPPELPSSDVLIRELEDFLKRRQADEGDEPR